MGSILLTLAGSQGDKEAHLGDKEHTVSEGPTAHFKLVLPQAG